MTTTIVSSLFYGVMEFWLSVLYEKSWSFSFEPPPQETPVSDQVLWEEVRLQLSDKREQLFLWKSEITGRELDGLLESKSSLHRELGMVILDALLRLAVSMRTSIGMIYPLTRFVFMTLTT